MAAPGAGVAAPVLQQKSLIPLITEVGKQLDLRDRRDRAEKERINEQFAEEISSIDYQGLTTDQIDALKNRTNSLVDLNANMIKTAKGDPRKIDRKTLLREQNSIRALGDKWRQFGAEISSVSKAVEMDKDNVYDKEAINNALVGMTYEIGPGGERKAKTDVNTGEAIAMLDNPAFMDPDAYIKREINNLDEITSKEFETQRGVPGFGTVGFAMQQKTRVPWKLDVDGQPEINPDTGEKVLDLETWGKMVLNDPNKRKHIQHFAAREGVTVNEWLHRKALEHNATPKTMEQVYFPRAPRTPTRAAAEQDVQKVFLDTVSGLLNQSPDLVSQLPQADEVDEEGVPYRDATEILKPYALTKVNGRALPFTNVYLKDGQPDTFLVRDTEGGDLRSLSGAEITNMVNAAGTLNTALRGIDSYAIKRGYITGQNRFNPDVNIMQDPRFLQERGELRGATVAARQESQRLLKETAGKVRSKGFWSALGPDQNKFAREITDVLANKTIRIKGMFDDITTIDNPTVEVDVTIFGKNKIIIKDGKKVVKSYTADEFADLIESEGFIVKAGALAPVEQVEPTPTEEPKKAPTTADEL